MSFASYVNGQYIQWTCSAINTALQITKYDFSYFGSHLQFQIRTGAVKRPSSINFAFFKRPFFNFFWSFNVNLNSKLWNIFMIILYFLDSHASPVDMLKFWFFSPVNSEEGESRKRLVNIVLHCWWFNSTIYLFQLFWIHLLDPVLPGRFLFDVCLISP